MKNIPEMEKLLQKAKSDFETAVDSDSKLSEQVRCRENSQYIESTNCIKTVASNTRLCKLNLIID